MAEARINFVELPCRDVASMQAFYGDAFGWGFTAFGPTYACTTGGDVDLGFQADPKEMTEAPLVAIEVPDIEAALAAVEGAGGIVTRPIFAFPGGRRFQFRDPAGNEMAAHQPD